jgi:E3 ubiquitin-protein ligase TRIP12
MDEDDAHWDEAGGSLIDDDHYHEDEDMEDSDHEEDDEDSFSFGGRGGASAYERLARMADASNLFDEATAAAIFGGDFRGFGGMMSGLSNRLKRLKTDLRSPKAPVRLKALRECSELLLVSNEETLGSSFSTFGFATEFIAILNGKPNIEKDAGNGGDDLDMDEDMDEDAQFAAALAMSAGGYTGGDDQEEMEAQLLACRCLAHLMEALPGSGHALVQLGAVPVLCSKLNEISYIELAEQTLSVSRSSDEL